MMGTENILVLDVETEIYEHGHPFHPDNYLCTVHYYSTASGITGTLFIQYPDVDQVYGGALQELQELIDNHEHLAGFNFKFDLHWLRRYGINFSGKSVIDVQYLFFLLTDQQNKYPSLQQVCEYLGIEGKFGYIEENYWSKGLLTINIPQKELVEYGENDVKITWKALLKLWEVLEEIGDSRIYNLFAIHMADLLVLEEMEWNGMLYDMERSEEVKAKLEKELEEVDAFFESLVPGVNFNPASGDQLSALLYGGKIYHKYKKENGVFKTGKRKGEVKYSNEVEEITLPGYVKPKEEWALKKIGYYSTDISIISMIDIKAKGIAKKITQAIMKRGDISKVINSYCNQISNLVEANKWPVKDGLATLHGNLNQCVAITGRLASSKPNLQNMDGEIKYLFVTRY